MPTPIIGAPAHLLFKMEDRKRSAGIGLDDVAPSAKRQAINGSSRPSQDEGMPWKDTLEEFQKDAIFRQMQEYKREKGTLESQLRDVQKRSVDHDDQLRIVDAWWTQLLEEVELLTRNVLSSPRLLTDLPTFPTALRFESSTEFSDHLANKSQEITTRLERIFTNLTPTSTPSIEVVALQKSLTSALAANKELSVQYDRLRKESEDIGERLEVASLRYLKAEKRLDRMKSEPVAKFEAKAKATSAAGAKSPVVKDETTNGIEEHSSISDNTRLALDEANAEIARQKEQLDGLRNETKSLTEQLTAASRRLTNFTDEDYARTELFKNFRAQHEDVLKRINHLEATNIQLREEAEKLQAERTFFRNQLESESESVTSDVQAMLERAEADLTRVRSARDELIADQSNRRAQQDQERVAIDQMRELCGAKDDRITSLESEIERLQAQIAGNQPDIPIVSDIAAMDVEELRQKYATLQRSFDSINNELPAMERAYKRSMALSSKKVMDFVSLEEKVMNLIAEKTKADQKYFSVRKDTDLRVSEVRSLRLQNGKSSEIISQLKDVEAGNRVLLTALEKAMSEVRHANSSLIVENKRLSGSAEEASLKAHSLQTQITELSGQLKSKDSSHAAVKERLAELEIDLDKLRKRYEAAIADRETYRIKASSGTSAEEEILRTIAYCSCERNLKDTALRRCGHVFCRQCVDQRMSDRSRKCNACMTPFDKADVIPIHIK